MTGKLIGISPSLKPERPSADSDNWFTPMKLWRPWQDELGFTVDAAGHPEAPVTKAIGRFYGPEQDGLKQNYLGERVWSNCPYSDIAPWVECAVRSIVRGASLWAMLLPAWTDRAWWHDYIEPNRTDLTQVDVELRFIRGRVRFGYPGRPDGGAGGGFDPSVLVLFRRGVLL